MQGAFPSFLLVLVVLPLSLPPQDQFFRFFYPSLTPLLLLVLPLPDPSIVSRFPQKLGPVICPDKITQCSGVHASYASFAPSLQLASSCRRFDHSHCIQSQSHLSPGQILNQANVRASSPSRLCLWAASSKEMMVSDATARDSPAIAASSASQTDWSNTMTSSARKGHVGAYGRLFFLFLQGMAWRWAKSSRNLLALFSLLAKHQRLRDRLPSRPNPFGPPIAG